MTLKTLVTAACAAAALAGPAAAQDLGVKAPPQKGVTCIVNATVHPVSAPAIENGAVWFADGVLIGVGSANELSDWLARVRLAQPPTTIDARDLHVWPGLIGAYTQLGLIEFPPVTPTVDTSETGGITPEVRAATAVNPDSTLIPVARSNGVLLAGVFPGGGTIAGQASVIRLDGWTTDDMTVQGCAGIVLRWPNVRPISAWWMDRSEDDQMTDIRRGQRQILDTFEAVQAYARAREGDPNAPTDLRWEAMRPLFPTEEDRKAGKKGAGRLFIAANDLEQINAAVTFAGERGIRCVIVGGTDAPLCADLLKKHDVPVIVQGTHRMPRRSDAAYDEAYQLPLRLSRAGIRYCIASGEETAHERNLPYAAAMSVAHGLPHEEGVRAVTLSAAEILGVADRYGSLDKGKSASLIITTGSPLEVTTRIRWAFIDGRMIDLANKQTRLYDKYRERYRQTGDLQPASR